MTTSLWKTIFICSSTLFALSFNDQASAKHGVAGSAIFQHLAKELIAGLDNSLNQKIDCLKLSTNQQFRNKVCRTRKKLRIALHPFKKQKIPISIKIADEFNERIFKSLTKHAGTRYEFIARSDLPALIEDREEWSNVVEKPVNKLLSESANIDVLIWGDLYLENTTAILSYKANGMDGTRLASTSQQKITLNSNEIRAPEAVFALEQIITKAVNALSDKASDMETLLLASIVFENSGSPAPFGNYLQDRLSSAFQDKFSNLITEKKLQVLTWSKERQDKKRAYTLRGKFWDLSNTVELRISLRNAENEVVSWRGWIRPDTIRRPVRPKGDFSRLRENDGLGPFAFHLTSDRGLNPVYQVGDYLTMRISLDSDAWLYCFIITADKKSKQLFPNPFFWKQNKEPLVASEKNITIPDDAYSLYPFNLKISGPPGPELIKCFAASRDVTLELPKELQGRKEGLLPQKIVPRLCRYFQELDDVAISEASFVMTVKRKNRLR